MQLRNTKGRRAGRFGSERGQSMIEFSLVFVLFVVMMGGLFEFSRMLWAYTTLAHATRQGARFAMVHGVNNSATDAQIKAKVTSEAIGLGLTNAQVQVTFSPNNNVGSFVNIQATYPMPMVIGALLLPTSRRAFTLKATSQMVVLN